ncbi:hypothetical protein QYF36_025985 [Acer negundo]|nr:hypothetical protein QYF36_025985 [Acer negundo]
MVMFHSAKWYFQQLYDGFLLTFELTNCQIERKESTGTFDSVQIRNNSDVILTLKGSLHKIHSIRSYRLHIGAQYLYPDYFPLLLHLMLEIKSFPEVPLHPSVLDPDYCNPVYCWRSIYLKGQSVGAHISSCALLEQAIKESRGGENILWSGAGETVTESSDSKDTLVQATLDAYKDQEMSTREAGVHSRSEGLVQVEKSVPSRDNLTAKVLMVRVTIAVEENSDIINSKALIQFAGVGEKRLTGGEIGHNFSEIDEGQVHTDVAEILSIGTVIKEIMIQAAMAIEVLMDNCTVFSETNLKDVKSKRVDSVEIHGRDEEGLMGSEVCIQRLVPQKNMKSKLRSASKHNMSTRKSKLEV